MKCAGSASWAGVVRRAIALAMGIAGMTAWSVAEEKKIPYIDLQPKANQNMTDPLHRETSIGNNLAELPKGEQTFESVKFKIGDRLIQLGGKILPDKPLKVDGIQVDKTFEKLHILHATGFGNGMEGDDIFVADDTLVGQYTVNYEDKTSEVIQIIYGKDVRDWWYDEDSKGVTRGKVAWKGNNEFAKNNGAMIRLYLATWKNPKPDKKVVSIDPESCVNSVTMFRKWMRKSMKTQRHGKPGLGHKPTF